MSRIAVIIDNGFEDSEYLKPAEAFRREGHEIVHIGWKEGAVVKGKKKETPGTIMAASYCNIHGLWQNSAELAVE